MSNISAMPCFIVRYAVIVESMLNHPYLRELPLAPVVACVAQLVCYFERGVYVWVSISNLYSVSKKSLSTPLTMLECFSTQGTVRIKWIIGFNTH